MHILYVFVCTGICIYRAGGNGQATLVLAGPFFVKVKAEIHLYKKQVMGKVIV